MIKALWKSRNIRTKPTTRRRIPNSELGGQNQNTQIKTNIWRKSVWLCGCWGGFRIWKARPLQQITNVASSSFLLSFLSFSLSVSLSVSIYINAARGITLRFILLFLFGLSVARSIGIGIEWGGWTFRLTSFRVSSDHHPAAWSV